MGLHQFLDALSQHPQSIQFSDCIETIDESYEFTPCSFHNGQQVNAAGENNGSCKIFAFAQLHQLDEAQTLACFGDYYRRDVLDNPQGEDHQNIRQFMQHGWGGISFDQQPLKAR